MLQAVIFDFDGVITDSEILHFRTFNMILEQFGVTISKKDYYQKYLGLSDRDFFLSFIEKGFLEMDADHVPELIKQKNLLFTELAETEGHIIEGVKGFIELLKENRIPIAICSGALLCEIELILEQASLRHYFEHIVSAEQVTKGKPHPQGFLMALERLNKHRKDSIDAGNCIVIEDSSWGLKAGKAAKMKTVAVTNSYDREQLSTADLVVENLSEIKMPQLQLLCN